MAPHVLVTARRALEALDRYRHALEGSGCRLSTVATSERLTERELLPLVGDVDAILCGDDRITAQVLSAAPRLRVIVKWGTGIDGIDLAAARARGVRVCNTPDAFSEPVADTVLGYVLMFARRLDVMTADIRAGRWHHVPLRALSECSLGIVGLGNIGRAVARRAAAFGMKVSACDVRAVSRAEAAALGVTITTLEELLAQSDFVSLSADLRRENRHLVDADRLRLMKPEAVLINTARGGLVHEPALIDALETGRLAGAALDVFEDEPLPAESPLRRLSNVHLAPHNANASPAAADRVHANSIRSLLEALGLPTP